MAFEETTEKIFRERVRINTEGILYKEYGKDFVRFRCPETGKLFEVKVTEKFSKEIKQKLKGL
jgi:hypothetical protein